MTADEQKNNRRLAELLGWKSVEVEVFGELWLSPSSTTGRADQLPNFHNLDALQKWVWPVIHERGLWNEYIQAAMKRKLQLSASWFFAMLPVDEHVAAAIKVLEEAQ